MDNQCGRRLRLRERSVLGWMRARVSTRRPSTVTILDRHILREWFAILGLVLGATTGLLVMNTLYSDLENLLELKAGAWTVVEYFLIKLPGFSAAVFPLVLLISLLYTLGRLHHNNEITAMRAAGLGLGRITRSIWVTGVFFCGLVWLLNATLVPWSVERSRQIWDSLEFKKQAATEGASRVGLRTGVAFDNRRAGRMWYFNRYNELTGVANGVTVVEMDAQHRERTRILAREARRDPAAGFWTFIDGREIWIDPDSGDVMRTTPFAEKPMGHYREDPALMNVFDVKPDDLSVFELARIVRHYEAEANPKAGVYAMRYYSVLAETVGPLIIIAIAVPFAVAGVRVNPAVGVSKAIGLFVLYFLVLKVFTALGARGLIDPLWAALLPNLVLLGVGGFYLTRAR